jgi:phosphonate transport system ATP-binding protein
MVFQQFNLIGRLDVLTNVLMGSPRFPHGAPLLGLWPDKDKAIALAALEQFDLGQLAAQRADHLSGGQQQRVAIARALVQEPELILADEPIASLDPHNTRVMMDALQRINKHFGITVMCNLHSLEIARGYCDRLIGMAAGKVVFDGTPVSLTDAAARDLYGIASDQTGKPIRRSQAEWTFQFRAWATPSRDIADFRNALVLNHLAPLARRSRPPRICAEVG